MPITPVGKNEAEMMTMGLALIHLRKSPSAAYALSLNYKVEINYSGNNMFTPVGQTVLWDPSTAMQVVNAQGVIGVQSPAMGLLHELAHALFGYGENAATAFETQVANELGEPVRATYESTLATVIVQDPTQHTDNGQWTVCDTLGNVTKGETYNGGTTAPKMSNWNSAAGAGGIGGSAGAGSGGTGAGNVGGNGGSGPNPSTPPPPNPKVTPILVPN